MALGLWGSGALGLYDWVESRSSSGLIDLKVRMQAETIAVAARRPDEVLVRRRLYLARRLPFVS